MTTTTAIGYRTCHPVTAPDCLVQEEITVAEPGPHDLLVEVAAVSVNPVDVKLRAGSEPDGLRVLGFDAAGTVTAVGDEVSLFQPGDEVYYAGAINRPGTNQRLHLVDDGRVRPVIAHELGPISVESLTEGHRLVEAGDLAGTVVLQGW